MRKPAALKPGDSVALVSLSSGMAGEHAIRHRYETGKRRLETIFGLRTVTMPHALKGTDYLDRNPRARAQDLMDAFLDDRIQAVFCMIGGDDTIRLLPYIDYDIFRSHPKIFMGYSDSTINHFMMHKAGLVSYQGPCVLMEFAENVAMHEYTVEAVWNTLFTPQPTTPILSAPEWTSEYLDWGNPEYCGRARTMVTESHGYELLQGHGVVRGELLGGCLSVFCMMIGTEIWPCREDWRNKLLFLETAEDYPTPDTVTWLLRNLMAQGILQVLGGIIVGKPMDETYYEEYKASYRKVVGEEAGMPELPILYNLNFGHTSPVCILPNGIQAQIDCDAKTLTLLEPPVTVEPVV